MKKIFSFHVAQRQPAKLLSLRFETSTFAVTSSTPTDFLLQLTLQNLIALMTLGEYKLSYENAKPIPVRGHGGP
jgi:hypothetical protein